jgi:MADS-box transcription factor
MSLTLCRHLKGEDITSLNPRELMLHEEALENGLSSIRERQVSIYQNINYLFD